MIHIINVNGYNSTMSICFQSVHFFQIQGLEKYVMTKLFTRVFASVPDDVKHDDQLSEKIALVQQFIRPENLDIKPSFQNETSWLVSMVDCISISIYFTVYGVFL